MKKYMTLLLETISLSAEQLTELTSYSVDEVLGGKISQDTGVQLVMDRIRTLVAAKDYWGYICGIRTITTNVAIDYLLQTYLRSFHRRLPSARKRAISEGEWIPKTEMLEVKGAIIGETIPGFEQYGILTRCDVEKRYSFNEVLGREGGARFFVRIEFEPTANRSDFPLQIGCLGLYHDMPETLIKGIKRKYLYFLKQERYIFQKVFLCT